MGASALVGAGAALAAPADAGSVMVRWSMDVNGSVVTDSGSGLSLDLVGSWAAPSGAVRFGPSTPSMGQSDDGGRLSPGTSDFAVAATFTTGSVPGAGHYSPNVVQKGLAKNAGQWKMELFASGIGTQARCRFEGHGGKVTATDQDRVRLDDGGQHTVVCWRAGSTFGVTVDGRSSTRTSDISSISPRTSVTVANKKVTATVEDQLQGTVSCVVFAKGQGAKDLAQSNAGC